VTVQRTGLPTFLARIWRRSTSTVTASATAEAYNPSGLTAPVQMVGVKPWFVPNCDPANAGPSTCSGGRSIFVSAADGSIANNGSFIGETIDFRRINPGTAPAFSAGPPLTSQFYALDVPDNPPTPVCPSTGFVSCGLVGTNDYLDNIACTSTFQFSCGQTIGTGQPVTVLTGAAYNTLTREGTRCLIHADTNSDGLCENQDFFGAACGTTPTGPPPITITGGDNNPNPSLQGVTNISRSDSVVTVPLFDGGCMGGGCTASKTIVGFLQLGITQSMAPGPNGRFEAVVLNAAGCNPGNTGNPVSGSGTSPLPVRLISP
jgi:hypothetical protein